MPWNDQSTCPETDLKKKRVVKAVLYCVTTSLSVPLIIVCLCRTAACARLMVDSLL